MNTKEMFFKHTPWSWKEFVQLLVLVFVFVPFFIEFLLGSFLSNLFQNDLYAGTLVGLIMSIIFLFAIYFIALKPKLLTWKEVGVNRFQIRYWRSVAGWTFVLMIISITIVIVMDLLGVGYENSKTESIQSQLTPIHFLIALVSASMISPVYEEILYRGFLYRWLRTHYGMTAGITVSAVIFMIVHLPTFNVLPIVFVCGLIFAWTYEKTHSVLPGIIIHGTFNVIALIVTASV